MRPVQRQLVQATWDHIMPMADVAADLFYSELLRRAPALGDYFGERLPAQKRLLVPTIGILVRGLDDLPSFLAAIRQLGRSPFRATHDMSHVPPATARAAMRHALRQILGDRYTTETEAAWDAVFDLVLVTARSDLSAA